MSVRVKYILCDFQENEIALDNRGASSMISDWDVSLLKRRINDIDVRVRNEIQEKIFRLGILQEGWDSYNGAPISENAIINAYYFISKIVEDGSLVIKRPVVSPEPNGGVLLKWTENRREFLAWITPHQQNCIYVEMFNGIRRGEKVDSLDKLLFVFKKWLGECLP